MSVLWGDKYLGIQIKDRVGWLNQFEPWLAIAEVAVQRERRLNEITHAISFHSTCLGARTSDTQTGRVNAIG
jgi:hypothetical protein